MPTILVKAWALDTPMFEGEETAGPIPTFFAEEVDTSREALNNNPVRGHADYQRLVRTFFMPEIIGVDEAPSIVKKPR